MCTYTYISVHVLCNLFSFMGSTQRRQLNIYYRRFRCFVPCNSVLLLLLLLLLLVCFVRSLLRYVWLSFWFLFHSNRSISIVKRLLCFRSHFRFNPNTFSCISYSTVFVHKMYIDRQNTATKKETIAKTTTIVPRLFLEILWCKMCNDSGSAGRELLHMLFIWYDFGTYMNTHNEVEILAYYWNKNTLQS